MDTTKFLFTFVGVVAGYYVARLILDRGFGNPNGR